MKLPKSSQVSHTEQITIAIPRYQKKQGSIYICVRMKHGTIFYLDYHFLGNNLSGAICQQLLKSKTAQLELTEMLMTSSCLLSLCHFISSYICPPIFFFFSFSLSVPLSHSASFHPISVIWI